MSHTLPPCPACASVYTYELGALLVCPECAHEWEPAEATGDDTEEVRDVAWSPGWAITTSIARSTASGRCS